MARWGRTTDIEWVYRVEVDESGRRVDGSAVYHAPLHLAFRFTGRFEGDHPVLQTCTQNNNLCDVVPPDPPLRFLLDGYLPQPSSIGWRGSVTLTRESPSAVLWRPGTA